MPGKENRAVVASAEVDERLQRVLQSGTFEHSPRLRTLLSYIGEYTARGATDELKEQAIGERVFGRPPSYNPSEDNIVRSSVRQLRAKLQEYYETEGSSDEWRIEIPKGAYQLLVRPAVQPAPPLPDIEQPPSRRTALILLGAVCGAFAAGYATHGSMRTTPSKPETLLGLLHSTHGRRVHIVVPDEGVLAFRDLTGRVLSLNEFIGRTFLDKEALPKGTPDEVMRYLRRETTGFWAFAQIAGILAALPGGPTNIRHPRNMDVRDLENDSALLIGGPFANPWTQLFEDRLSFRIATDPGALTSHIRDTAPGPKEKTIYRHQADGNGSLLTYARIAYLPSLSGIGKVLLAGGPHSSSTEAAIRFLTEPGSSPEVLRRFGVQKASELPWFELLLEAQENAGAPVRVRVVAHRKIP